MDDKILIQRSIDHWERMIKWAATKKIRDHADPEEMVAAIGENWFAEYCALCREYNNAECKDYDESYCPGCPISLVSLSCEEGRSVWVKVAEAKTWGTWLKWAHKMVSVLKKCKEEAGKKTWKR